MEVAGYIATQATCESTCAPTVQSVTATALISEAAETTFSYDDLSRTATLTLPKTLAFSQDTDVPFNITITEYKFSEDFPSVSFSETLLVNVPYVPKTTEYVVEIEEEVEEPEVEEPVEIVKEEKVEEEEEVVEEAEQVEEEVEPAFVSVFKWTPPAKPKAR